MQITIDLLTVSNKFMQETLTMFRLDGRLALVSCAGRGMDFGVEQILARQGATVVINDFFSERADAASKALQSEGLKAYWDGLTTIPLGGGRPR